MLINVPRKLSQIQGDIIQEIYHQNIPSIRQLPLQVLMSRILSIDHDLRNWRGQLHQSLSLALEGNFDALQVVSYTRPQIVIAVRYLSIRLLLYRRLLAFALDRISTPPSSPESDYLILHGMLQVLIETSLAVITLIRALAAHTEVIQSWWFYSYYGGFPVRKLENSLIYIFRQCSCPP